MPSTHTSLHYHLEFSTKHREATISSGIRAELHEYLGGTVNGLGGFAQGVGGVEDHVHLLLGLKATHRLADVVRELKKASSAWMRNRPCGSGFAWQEGYAAFSVSAPARAAVIQYISRQEEHHRQHSFGDELRALLRRADVTFDERCFWIDRAPLAPLPGCGLSSSCSGGVASLNHRLMDGTPPACWCLSIERVAIRS